jgi:acyl-CoA reductase-like NAD-dependent aldehyde dehydrogenase
MSIAAAEVVTAFNPATGEELGRIAATPPSAVAEIVERARRTQQSWRTASWPERREVLARWLDRLRRDPGEWVQAIRLEVGKPRSEALAELAASLDAIAWTVRHAGKILAPERVGAGRQRLLMMPTGWVHHEPLGVVGMIGTWNYPFLLNAPLIAQALAAGNAVVWKPSELASLAGRRLQRTFDEAGFPEGLVAAVHGGPEVGQALVDSNIDKGVFTGGIASGRQVLAALATRGIPALAELSGFDPAIVLADAPLHPTARALAWGAFVGSGQACVAVKRVYVVGDPAPWTGAIAEQASSLRLGDPALGDVDMGPMISESARDRFDATVRAAVAAGARLVTGGCAVDGPGWFYRPTVLAAETAEVERALEGVFGPVVVVRGVESTDAAVAAANASRFGLAASVWGLDVLTAEEVAARLDAGIVTINDVVAPTAGAGVPFGGAKASGFGRTKGAHGLREFVRPKAVLTRESGSLRPQLYPYSPRVERALGIYLRMFHRGG